MRWKLRYVSKAIHAFIAPTWALSQVSAGASLKEVLAPLLLISLGSACSFGSADRKSVEVSLPPEIVHAAKLREAALKGQNRFEPSAANRSASTQALSVTHSTLADFKCFGMVVAGSDLTPHPKAGTCKNFSIISGLISATQTKASFSLQVPSGENREFILFGMSTSGDCPNIDDVLYERVDYRTLSPAYVLGRTTTKIASDATISIKASFNASTAEALNCSNVTSTDSTTTSTTSSTGSSTGSTLTSTLSGSAATLTLTFSSSLSATLSSSQLITILGTVSGTATVNQATVTFYGNATCNSGYGTVGALGASDFNSSGAVVTVGANTSITVYGQASYTSGTTTITSSCMMYSGGFTHDSIAPGTPTQITITGAYHQTGYPFYGTLTTAYLKAQTDADVDGVKVYTNVGCSGGSLANGQKSDLEGAGLAFNVTPGTSTTLYLMLMDRAGNNSACTLAATYNHDITPPTPPSTVSTGVVPRVPTSSPPINWTSSSDTGGVDGIHYIARILSAGTLVSPIVTLTGTSYTFNGLTLTGGATYTVYVEARDALGNTSTQSSAGWTAQDLATQLTVTGSSIANPTLGACTAFCLPASDPFNAPKYVHTATDFPITYSGPASNGLQLYSDSACASSGIQYLNSNATACGYARFNRMSSGVLTLSANDINGTISISVVRGETVLTHKLGSGTVSTADGYGHSATVNTPMDFIEVPALGKIFYTDQSGNRVRAISPETDQGWHVSNFAGDGTSANLDGNGLSAQITSPTGIATDGTYLYITQDTTHLIRRIHLTSGAVISLAGETNSSGNVVGSGTSARFDTPTGIAFWPSSGGGIPNRLIVADTTNRQIKVIENPENQSTVSVSLLAGNGTLNSNDDSTGSSAGFISPKYLAMAGDYQSVYVSQSSCIRKINLSHPYAVSTPYGDCGTTGNLSGALTISTAAFDGLRGIRVYEGHLYAVDSGNNRIIKINLSSHLLTVLGSGPGWNSANGLSVGIFGLIFGDSTLHKIYMTQ